MKRIYSITAAALALAVVMALPGVVDARILDRIVARVNNDIITLHEVRQSAIPFLLQSGRNPAVLDNPAQRDAILKETLEELVDRKLIGQEAKKIDFTIRDEELDQWLAYTRQQQQLDEQQFIKVIEDYGMKYSAYREMVRQNLLKVRMIKIKVGSQVTITDEDIEARFKDKFGESPTQTRFRTIRHILVRPGADTAEAHEAAVAKLQRIQQQLAAGDDFEELAKAHSEGPSADKGGLIGTFKRGDLDPQFESTAFALEVGEISGVVETKFGYHLMRVDDQELRENPDVDGRREAIRNEIEQEQMEQLLKQYMSELRSKAFVEIKY